MTRIAGRTEFTRPPAEVFELLADPRNESRYNPLILAADKTSGGPIGVGTRFVQQAKSFGRIGDVDIEVVEYRRPERLAFAIRSSGIDVHGALAIAPHGSGCVVDWIWDLRPRGAWRLLGPLMALGGRRLERRVWEQMRRYVDASGTEPAATATHDEEAPS